MSDGEIILELRRQSDGPKVTQADVDRAARFVALYLYRGAPGRYRVFHEGRELIFDASDSSRWTGTEPAVWAEPPEGFSITKEEARRLLREGLSPQKYAELAAQVDEELGAL